MIDGSTAGGTGRRRLLITLILLCAVLLAVALIFVPRFLKAPEEEERTVESVTPEAEKKLSKDELEKRVKKLVKAQTSGEAGPLLQELKELSPSDGASWEELLAYWSGMSESGFVNVCGEDAADPLPEGLPQDDSLCIVVLGYQLKSDGTMREELEKRLNMALAAAKQYPQAFVCVTGGHTASANGSASEGGAMASWLLSHGIPDERIISETESRTTVENAVFCQRIFRERYPQISAVAIVTSDYHIKLGSLLFNSRFILQEKKSPRVVANAANRTGGDYYFTAQDEAYWLSDLLGYD